MFDYIKARDDLVIDHTILGASLRYLPRAAEHPEGRADGSDARPMENQRHNVNLLEWAKFQVENVEKQKHKTCRVKIQAREEKKKKQCM